MHARRRVSWALTYLFLITNFFLKKLENIYSINKDI